VKFKPKPKRQDGDPVGYNPGGESVKITARAIKRNGVFNMVYMDPEIATNLAAVTTSVTYPTHTKVDPENHEIRDVWHQLCLQLVNMAMFKQLASSVRADYSYVTDHFGRAPGKRVILPIGLMPIIRTFGTVSDEIGDFELSGQPIHAVTALLRAIADPIEQYAGVPQAVNRSTSMCFDPGMPNAWAFLIDYCRGVVNQYAENHDLTINNGGMIAVVRGVLLTSGFETFFAAFQATNFPVQVLRALRAGNLAEGALRLLPVPVGNAVPAGIVNGLNAEGFVVVAWTRDGIEMRTAQWYDQVQSRMSPTLDEIFVMGEVSMMGNKGDGSLLVSRTSVENAFIPIKVPGDQLEMGTMMSTARSGATMRLNAFRVDSDYSQMDAIMKWFEGMKKGKKKGGQ
jgi:hypothetical protein